MNLINPDRLTRIMALNHILGVELLEEIPMTAKKMNCPKTRFNDTGLIIRIKIPAKRLPTGKVRETEKVTKSAE